MIGEMAVLELLRDTGFSRDIALAHERFRLSNVVTILEISRKHNIRR
jgi:hypothetical protein